MTSMRLAGLALLSMTFGAVAVAQAPNAPAPAAAPAEDPDGYYQRIERVADGVWAIVQNRPFHLQPTGNVTVIEQADGLVLIDAGGSPGAGRRIAEMVASVSRKPVKAIVVTHWHGDHSLGVSAIRARWPGARVITTARTRDNLLGPSMAFYAKDAPDPARTAAFLERLQPIDEFLRRVTTDAARPEPIRAGFAGALRELTPYREDVQDLFVVRPTETFENRLLLDDPERPIELIHPGRANTDGDAIAWLPRQRIVATGDLVVMPIPFGFGSYPEHWVSALNRIRGLDYRLLIPGHGAPQRDRAYLDQLIALISDMRAQMAPLAAQALELDAARPQIDVSRHQQLFAGDDPWLQLWFRNYWVMPFTESLWKEARGVPITQGEG